MFHLHYGVVAAIDFVKYIVYLLNIQFVENDLQLEQMNLICEQTLGINLSACD